MRVVPAHGTMDLMRHIVIRAVEDGKPARYRTSSGWSDEPGRAEYYDLDTDMSVLVRDVLGCYRGPAAGTVRIEPVVIEIAVESFVEGHPDWLNALRAHALKKLTPMEIEALGVEQHALFQKMGEPEPKKRGRRASA